MSTASQSRGSGRHAPAPAGNGACRRRFALLVALIGLVGMLGLLPAHLRPTDDVGTSPDVDALQARARHADDLAWLRAQMGAVSWPAGMPTRSDLVHQKDRLRARGDAPGAARLSGILA